MKSSITLKCINQQAPNPHPKKTPLSLFLFFLSFNSYISLSYSMGGSVAVHVAAKKALPSVAGLVVVDVVEVCSREKKNLHIVSFRV